MHVNIICMMFSVKLSRLFFSGIKQQRILNVTVVLYKSLRMYPPAVIGLFKSVSMANYMHVL